MAGTLTFPVAVRASLRSRSPAGLSDLAGGGLSEAFADWDSRFEAGMGKEETPGWRQNGGARRGRTVRATAAARPARPVDFREPGVQSAPPLFLLPPPRKPVVWVPEGRGPRRRGAGWPFGASRGARQRRAAATRCTRLHEKAGGAAKPQGTHRAEPAATARVPRPPGAGNSAAPPSCLGEKLSDPPGGNLQALVPAPWARECRSASQGEPALSKHSYLPNNGTVGLETPLCPGEDTSGKLIFFRTDFPFTTPQKAVSASLRPSCPESLRLGLSIMPGQLSATDPQRAN